MIIVLLHHRVGIDTEQIFKIYCPYLLSEVGGLKPLYYILLTQTDTNNNNMLLACRVKCVKKRTMYTDAINTQQYNNTFFT